MTSDIPPLKLEALLLLARGPLILTPGLGWQSGFSGKIFNSHTVEWMVSQRLANREGTVARATEDGIRAARRLSS